MCEPQRQTPLPFQLAAGSVIGRDHLNAGRNNQDAFCCHQDERGLIAVVCDGCGSGRHSEVGAKLGARLLVNELCARLSELQGEQRAAALRGAQAAVLKKLEQVLLVLGGRSAADVHQYLLFTIVGAVVSCERTLLFALGDGLAFLNAQALPLNKVEKPSYLGYALIPEALEDFPSRQAELQILADIPSGELQSLALCSDGAGALALDTLAELWRDEKYFHNPQALPRRLTQINREIRRVDWERRLVDKTCGPLLDDTTIVVVRRSIVAQAASLHGK